MVWSWLLEYDKIGFEKISSLYWLGEFEQQETSTPRTFILGLRFNTIIFMNIITYVSYS